MKPLTVILITQSSIVRFAHVEFERSGEAGKAMFDMFQVFTVSSAPQEGTRPMLSMPFQANANKRKAKPARRMVASTEETYH